jgi:hypothetical protein
MGAKNELHEPTQLTRDMVSNLCMVGIQQEIIAKVLRVSRPTLMKHYRVELDASKLVMLAEVCGALYKNAVVNENVAAQIFIMKTQGGWRETDRHEFTAANGESLSGPLVIMPNWVKPDGGGKDGES